jgi:ATP-dependent helicase/nuclease subunit A
VFFAGEGARETARTLFVVGDQKQSIFSFQGADLEGLARVHHDLRRRANAAGVPWLERAMTHSFRSAPAILDAVDTVFARPEARAGVVPDGSVVRHVAGRADAPGRVEIWPLASGDPPTATSPWDVPTAYPDAVRAIDRLAAHVADRIAAMIGRAALPSRGRPVRPGDVMILVRTRDQMMHAMVRALRRRDVPVAGIDRIALTGPLAVRDLLGLVEVALLPEDDLTLAAVLKGPLVGLVEDELYALAAGRAKGVRLWTALARAARHHERFARAHRWLAGLMARADFATPYGFLCAALDEPAAQDGAGSGRHAMLRRLGLEAEDPIDELLTQALAFERSHAPTLQGFAHWLGRADVEVTRDPEHGRDEVRVLTVHGAKGLEAPIVILPDTTGLPNAGGVRLDWSAEDGPIWSGRAAFAEELGAGAKQARLAAEAAEYRRLLYVALTRAADHLIVAGLAVKGSAPDGSWYRLVRDALEPVARAEPFDAWPGDALVLEAAGGARGSAPDEPPAEPELPALPPWLRRPAPIDAPIRQPLAPSRGPEEPSAGSPRKADADRRRRGRLIHRLLELLPAVAPAARAGLAERLLARHGADLDAVTRAAMAAEVLAVMAAPGLADLFGPGSRAEVPIVGVVGDRVVAGQVDRLVVGAEAIVIVDYKSDRAVPDQVPAAYRRQMALYAAVLRQVFPRHRVTAVLIWTEGPRVMPVPDLA